MMPTSEQKIRIVITGPESTGKTTLASQLADHFHGAFIPEFAREYVAKLPTHYTFDDVEAIARKQLEQYAATSTATGQFCFFDTWLIITKVWFRWVYGRVPVWLEEKIRECPMDFYLLCLPDLPWEPDDVRENGGENRLRLFEEYRNELANYGFPFAEIGGSGAERFDQAVSAVLNFLQSHESFSR